MRARARCSVAITLIAASAAHAQTTTVRHGVRPERLIIRNATIVDGNGTPAKGPFDIVLEGNTITQLAALDPVALRGGDNRRPRADGNTAEIDATGKYVLPGLINGHAHLQDERSGVAQPIEYEPSSSKTGVWPMKLPSKHTRESC